MGVPPPRRRRGATVAATLALGLACAVGLRLVSARNDQVTTDDAYTDGYVEAVAPQVAGRVVSLDVADNQFVRRGQALVHIDPRGFVDDRDAARAQLDVAKARFTQQELGARIAGSIFPAAYQEALADVAAAEATLARRQADHARQKGLPQPATTQRDVDAATADLKTAQAQIALMRARAVQAEPIRQQIGQADELKKNSAAQIKAAEAGLAKAELDLSRTVVRAGADGWVANRLVNAGDYVRVGQQILSLVSTQVWVTADFAETAVGLVRPGQKVRISVDAYPGLDLRGHVDSVQAGAGTHFSNAPAENAANNHVKITQRVPVKIVIDSGLDPDLPLPLGISVVPRVAVR